MPRFFFNLYGRSIAIDEEGADLSGVPAARENALTAARAIIAEDALAGSIDLRDRIEVEDEDRRPVLVLPFKAAVQIEGLPEHEDRPPRAEPRR